MIQSTKEAKQEKKELGSFATALGAKPKAKAAASTQRMFTMKDPATRRAWADQNEGEQVDAQMGLQLKAALALCSRAWCSFSYVCRLGLEL